jgi:hypothetical protein
MVISGVLDPLAASNKSSQCDSERSEFERPDFYPSAAQTPRLCRSRLTGMGQATCRTMPIIESVLPATCGQSPTTALGKAAASAELHG